MGHVIFNLNRVHTRRIVETNVYIDPKLRYGYFEGTEKVEEERKKGSTPGEPAVQLRNKNLRQQFFFLLRLPSPNLSFGSYFLLLTLSSSLIYILQSLMQLIIKKGKKIGKTI